MADRDLTLRLSRRLKRAGVDVGASLASDLAAYVELLAKWNRKINLTALPLDPITDDAVDRLIVEPVLAARRALPSDILVIDVGSGGGSPAIPFLLAVPRVRLTMVEVKVRKCAFLREVLRQLSLERGSVENCRLEELLARSEMHESADLVLVRAVRPDKKLLQAIQSFLKPGARLFVFGAEQSAKPEGTPMFVPTETDVLLPSIGSRLVVFHKSPRTF